MHKKIANLIFTILGFLFVIIGAIGAVLPILPTTPFLLLALACFAKGSVRFHAWFISTNLYKKHLDSFVTTRSMTARSKAVILSTATCMLILAMILVPVWPVWIFISCLIVAKYYYFLFHIKTIAKEPKSTRQKG